MFNYFQNNEHERIMCSEFGLKLQHVQNLNKN